MVPDKEMRQVGRWWCKFENRKSASDSFTCGEWAIASHGRLRVLFRALDQIQNTICIHSPDQNWCIHTLLSDKIAIHYFKFLLSHSHTHEHQHSVLLSIQLLLIPIHFLRVPLFTTVKKHIS